MTDEDAELTDELRALTADLRAFQPRRPSAAQFVSVGLGLGNWSEEERRIINGDPALLLYEARMQEELRSWRRRCRERQESRAAPPAEAPKRPPAWPYRLAAYRLAGHESEAQPLLSWRGVTEEGAPAEIFNHTRPGCVTLLLRAAVPPHTRVRAGGRVLELVKPFNEFGRAVLRLEDVLPVVSGGASLSVSREGDNDSLPGLGRRGDGTS